MAEENRGSLFSKMVKVMEEVGYVPKTGKNREQGYSFASDEEIMGRVQAAFVHQGLAFFSSCEGVEREEAYTTRAGNTMYLFTVKMVYTFADPDTGDYFVVRGVGQGTDPGDKGIYKAITGATKYALLKSLLIPTGDDPEKDNGYSENNREKTENGNKKAQSGQKNAPSGQKTSQSGTAHKSKRAEVLNAIWKKYVDYFEGDEVKAKKEIVSQIGNKPQKEWEQEDLKLLKTHVDGLNRGEEDATWNELEMPSQKEAEEYFSGTGEEEEKKGPMSTQAQQKYIHVLADKLDLSDSDLLDTYFFLTGTDIESSKDLTKSQAHDIIDNLTNDCKEKGIELNVKNK